MVKSVFQHVYAALSLMIKLRSFICKKEKECLLYKLALTALLLRIPDETKVLNCAMAENAFMLNYVVFLCNSILNLSSCCDIYSAHRKYAGLQQKRNS